MLSIETEMGSGFVPCLKVVSGSKDVENPVEVVSDVDWSKSEVTVADVDVSCILLNEDVSYSFVSRELLVLSNWVDDPWFSDVVESNDGVVMVE